MDHTEPPRHEAKYEAPAWIYRREEASSPSYRSEGFAEDLVGTDAADAGAPEPRPPKGLLMATPLAMSLAGAVLALFERVA